VQNKVNFSAAPNLIYSSQWQICADNGSWQQTERGPLTYGPAIQVIDGPLLFVYGTLVILRKISNLFIFLGWNRSVARSGDLFGE
jgi:hypothetical protein